MTGAMERVRMLLWPASFLYGLGARARVWCYRRGWFAQKRLQKPVICVGNLTVGGTGKTPMVMWIARRFAQQGKRVGILTRGFKGKRVWQAGEESGEEGREILWSDEARLMESRLPQEFARVGVGADRFASGSKLESWADYFLLDDGLQRLQLARDVNIVLIDALEPFGGGHLLPAGNLREPKSGLSRADVVVITRSAHSPAIEAVVRRYSEAPIFNATVKMDAPRLYGGSAVQGSGSATERRKFFAFCGIGNPRGFIGDLHRAEIPVAGQFVFRDHHRYSVEDMRHLESAARDAGANALLCTEKDLFNLDDAAPTSIPLWFCAMEFELNDAAGYWEAITSTLARRRSGSGQP
jgi:tetraacyldisaccharide 4'-kinase